MYITLHNLTREMEKIKHDIVSVNGINMHVAELGRGPLVLLLHGFPECWYTWRHQILYLASHHYRVVAPDLRGFGDTTGAPTSDVSKFTTLHVVGDLVGLLEVVAPHEEKVFVVGHDWGAMVAWALCLYRPDKVKALVNMSVVFTPRSPIHKPIDVLHHIYGDDYYIIRFQEPGDIEAEFAEMGTERVLKNFLTYHKPTPIMLPKGVGFGESSNTPITLPSWLSMEDMAFYTSKYEQSGFTGGLNYYRALNKNWEETAAWTGARVQVPVKFIVGDMDLTYNSPATKDYIHNGGFKKDVPFLKDIVILKGVGHFLHEERPNEINQQILSFFKQFKSNYSCGSSLRCLLCCK